MAELRSPGVFLTVGGVVYGGWQRVRIVRSMENLAHAFDLTVHERWPGQDVARPIRPGAPCTVEVEGETILTGYVDDVEIGYDAQSHEVRVTGRSKTGDLVDCAAMPFFGGRFWNLNVPLPDARVLNDHRQTGSWANFSLLDLARDLCKPYGIDVWADMPVGTEIDVVMPFKHLRVSGGTVFEALETAARYRGVLLTTDGAGNLVITRASLDRLSTALVRGQNVLACNAQFSWRERFALYFVKGQFPGGSDGALGIAMDAEISDGRHYGRFRPHVTIADMAATSPQCQALAEFERNVRFGRGQRIIYTVPGWTHRDGLWSSNVRVAVNDDWSGVEKDYLIVGTALLLDEQGSRVELTLCPPETFERVPLPQDSWGVS